MNITNEELALRTAMAEAQRKVQEHKIRDAITYLFREPARQRFRALPFSRRMKRLVSGCGPA